MLNYDRSDRQRNLNCERKRSIFLRGASRPKPDQRAPILAACTNLSSTRWTSANKLVAIVVATIPSYRGYSTEELCNAVLVRELR